MGASASKQDGPGKASKHVFRSDTPVQFSQNLVDSLQSSAETDSSRAQTMELHIQNRVAEELERIQAREKQTLADLEKRLAETNNDSEKLPPPAKKKDTGPPPLTSLDAPRVPLAGPGSAAELSAQSGTEEAGVSRDISSKGVAQEIESLRTKLAGRQKIKKLDEGVEKARENVVSCLRGNDRRPLDCWQEVDAFKREVARMESQWVERVVS